MPKTSCGKVSNETSQDKVLELVMQMMTGFTDKLNAMAAKISEV